MKTWEKLEDVEWGYKQGDYVVSLENGKVYELHTKYVGTNGFVCSACWYSNTHKRMEPLNESLVRKATPLDLVLK